jgi:hypothetical protein
LQVLAFWTVKTISSGRPPLPARMSRRLSSFSIQYGPSVTSGVSTQAAASASAAALPPPRRVAPSSPPRPSVPAAASASRRRRPRRLVSFGSSCVDMGPWSAPKLGIAWEEAVSPASRGGHPLDM